MTATPNPKSRLRGPSQHDVAVRAGVSRGAVYAALSGRECTIKLTPETHARILRVAREMNYRRDITGLSLVQRRSFLVAFLVRNSLRHVLPSLLVSMQDVTEANGCSLVVYYHGDSVADEAKHLEMAVERQVDGLVLYPALEQDGTTNLAQLLSLRQQGLPVVQLDHRISADLPSVVPDYAAGMQLAMAELRSLGHRRIALHAPAAVQHEPTPGWYGVGALFYRAYLEVCASLGERPLIAWRDDRPPAETLAMPQSGAAFRCADVANARRVLELPERPTAVLCAGDDIAIPLIFGLQALGVAVPQDLSVVGSHQAGLRTAFSGLATRIGGTAWDPQELGRRAMELLFAEIANPGTNPPAAVRLPLRWVPGDSVGPVPGPDPAEV